MDLEQLTVRATHRFAAAPDAVWALLSDPERTAGLGPEVTEARWSGAERGVGAVFTGTNVRGDRRWEVPCTVTASEPGRLFAWSVLPPERASSTWSYTLSPDGAGGTVVEQVFRHGPGPSFLRRAVEGDPDSAVAAVAVRSAELRAGMEAVLAAADRLLAHGTTDIGRQG